MLKKKLILITLSTICIQNSFAMEPENDEYSRTLVLYRSAQNKGNVDVAADHLEELLRRTSQKPTQNTNNNDNGDINFFDEYTKLALEFRRQGKEKQAIDCDNCAERFRTKGYLELGVINAAWLYEMTTAAAAGVINNKETILNGIKTTVTIFATGISLYQTLYKDPTPAPSIQPERGNESEER